MTRPVAIAGMLVLALSPLAVGATGVRVEGAFVQTGTFVEIDHVDVGQPIQLLVRVRDISDEPLGVAGGLVDVSWNKTVLELQDAIDDTNGTTADVSPLFNQAVWKWSFTGILNQDGDVEGMGAGQTIPPTLSEGEAELFFRLNFIPQVAGAADMSLVGREFGVIVSGGGKAAAGTHQSVNPSLTVNVPTDPDVTPDPGPGIPCFSPIFPLVGLLMAAGCCCRRGRR